jgi:hypothetical protein
MYTLNLELVSTMKISNETKRELVKIGAEYSLNDARESYRK